VELDREALAVLHRNYQLCGLTERDDQEAMQQVEPGWQFMPTRW
jgi:glucarate dehydratase